MGYPRQYSAVAVHITWTPKVCKVMAILAVFRTPGPLSTCVWCPGRYANGNSFRGLHTAEDHLSVQGRNT